MSDTFEDLVSRGKSSRAGLLEAIRAFKPDGLSDLDAALNLAASHAALIRKLADENERLRGHLLKLCAETTAFLKTADCIREEMER